MNTIQQLKKELWKRFGNTKYPAEWDGNIYGGGKLSQRFWEYFKAIELLNVNSDSIVLDIGGGSPSTGAGFFASLLSSAVKTVIVMDSNVPKDMKVYENIQFISIDGSYEEIKRLLIDRPDITHISSVSVFEHVPTAIREGMIRAINEYFQGCCFVATFEYHAKRTFFDEQLTAKTTSNLFSPLSNYYLDEIVASPVWCENAYSNIMVGSQDNTQFDFIDVPCWYPVAVRFLACV